MDFMEAVKTCLKKYFSFRGRARRSEYWWFYLFTIIVGIVANIVDSTVLGWGSVDEGPVANVTSFALLIPSLSAVWRRLHDTGRSGWWIGGGILAILVFVIILLSASARSVLVDGGSSLGDELLGVLSIVFVIAIFIYGITMLVFFCQDSQPEDNRYGPSPKYNSGASVFD